jgi:uridine kinase
MRIPWPQAPQTLRGLIPPDTRSLVCIAGSAGSGKSTLARQLGDLHGHATIIGTDAYLPDYSTLQEHEYDLPENSALDELAQHIDALLSGQAAEIPVWCFHEHRRTSSQRVEPADLLIVEGIHALNPLVSSRAHLKVLIEAPPDDRLQRILAREQAGERGWGIEQSTHFFQKVADPTFSRFLPEYRKAADIIVDNPGRPA